LILGSVDSAAIFGINKSTAIFGASFGQLALVLSNENFHQVVDLRGLSFCWVWGYGGWPPASLVVGPFLNLNFQTLSLIGIFP
jgi:hypothetical protein